LAEASILPQPSQVNYFGKNTKADFDGAVFHHVLPETA
jgi:hypothetical protein